MSNAKQKPDMTVEEFAEKWGKQVFDGTNGNPVVILDNVEDIASDLRSVVRGELMKEADELQKQNPYPESVFISRSDEKLEEVARHLRQAGYSPDALFGHWGRTVWNNCVERLKENNNQ